MGLRLTAMKRDSRSNLKFPVLVATHVKKDVSEQLKKIAARETEGTLSIVLRRALEEYVARHGRSDNASPSPA